MKCQDCGKEDFKESDIVYNCLNCKKTLCSICFWDEHSNHEYSEHEIVGKRINTLKPLKPLPRAPRKP